MLPSPRPHRRPARAAAALILALSALATLGAGCAATRAARVPKDVPVTTGDIPSTPLGYIQSDVWGFDFFGIFRGGALEPHLMQEAVDQLAARAKALGADIVIRAEFHYDPGVIFGIAHFKGEAARKATIKRE